MMEELDPRFKFPKSCTGLRACLDNAYSYVKQKIKEILQSLPHGCSLCLDIWSDSSAKHSYLGFTAHFISKENKLENIFLGLMELEDHHSAKHIKDLTNKIIEEYGLPEDIIVRYVSDNASNMAACFKHDLQIVKGYLEGDNEEEIEMEDAEEIEMLQVVQDFDEFELAFPKRMGCSVHWLQRILISIDYAKDCPTLSKLLHELKTLKKSTVYHPHIVRETGLSIMLPPIVRWGYLYLTLKRVFQIKEALTKNSEVISRFTNDEWQELEMLKQVFELFYEQMKRLQSTKSPTLHLVYPAIKILDAELAKNRTKFDQQLQVELQRKFRHVIDFSANEFDASYVIATFLNPSTCYFISDNDIDQVIRFTIALIGSTSHQPNPASQSSNQPDPYGSMIPSPISQSSYAMNLLELRRQKIEERYSSNGLYKFLKEYAELYMIPPQEEINPIEFWDKYPKNIHVEAVKNLAFRLLPIPGSTAGIERVFNVTGENVSRKKNRTLCELLNSKTIVYMNKHIIEEYIEELKST